MSRLYSDQDHGVADSAASRCRQVVRRLGTEQDAKLTVAVEMESHFTPLRALHVVGFSRCAPHAPQVQLILPSSAHRLTRSSYQQPQSTLSADIADFDDHRIESTENAVRDRINPLQGRGVNWLHFAIQV